MASGVARDIADHRLLLLVDPAQQFKPGATSAVTPRAPSPSHR